MNWETAVIMGLAAYSALVTTGIYSILRGRKPADPEQVPGPGEYGAQETLDALNADVFNPARAARMGVKSGPPKDNGSVILMTPERDARLLQDESD